MGCGCDWLECGGTLGARRAPGLPEVDCETCGVDFPVGYIHGDEYRAQVPQEGFTSSH